MKNKSLLISLIFTLILMNNSYGQYDFKLVDIENGKDIHYNQIFNTYNLNSDIPTLIITWSGKWCYPCIRLINRYHDCDLEMMNLITINVDEDSVRDEVMDKGYHLNWENALNFHANLGKDKKGFDNIFNVTTAPLVIIIEDGKISHAVGDYTLYPHKLLLGELINDYKFIWNNSEELNNLAWYYYNYVDDPAGLQIALECVKRSMELDKNYNNTDTYAALLFKTGENTKALKVAKEAIEIAKANDEDYETTTDLINEIIEEL